ncbi:MULTISPECIES: metal-dependent transcriptional regulator [Halolamina]|uniref:Iron (Metal) dependent repressor, DtxR family n=1 Tax=Halolamina pelagica TaxID=699431 RepID=A0A1I5R5W4_9EURY|nr:MULTISPECIES: metal-dependent transcriptional regulator [Halolamina]NHX35704.1 metal-dependent transcriptional regulator [Halolamina sp. R1-12]SFP53954.1 iron (metal) dependent repressor, DtxR family [Halolamina pelagica]
MLSDAMEDYLKAIYVLQRQDGAPVSTSAVAEYLDKTPPTVTSMMEKLDDRGLIDREKYRGVELTEEGETVALEVVRHHRLLEAYLAEHLDFDWTEVHDEADTLEHHISEDLERRMAEALDDPVVDPHGDPIPTETLEPVDEAAGERLSSFGVGDRVVVSRVLHREQDELDYLSAAGLTPNTTIEIVDVAPFGMVTVRLDDGEEQSLPEDVADAIRVRATTGEVA